MSAPEPAFWLLIGDTPTAVSLATVQEKLAAGELTWDARACPVGGSAWLPLGQIARLRRTPSPAETGPAGQGPLPVAKLLPLLDDDGLAKDEQQPSPEPSRAPVDYEAVPWYRRSAVISAFVLLGFCLFPPLLWAACLVCLTGGVFYHRARADGSLARWSAWNKAAAVVILLVQAAGLAGYASRPASGDCSPLTRGEAERVVRQGIEARDGRAPDSVALRDAGDGRFTGEARRGPVVWDVRVERTGTGVTWETWIRETDSPTTETGATPVMGEPRTTAKSAGPDPGHSVGGGAHPSRHGNGLPPTGSGAVDPAVRAVLGSESQKYTASGYRGIALGTKYSEVDRARKLPFFDTGRPWAFRTTQAGDEEFFFDADKRLVCYARAYNGGPDDYLGELIELFGKTDKPIQDFTTTADWTNMVRRTTIAHYTFPHVLARVAFDHTVAAQSSGERPLTRETTYVSVADRRWVEAVLGENAVRKRKAIEWLVDVAERVKGGVVDARRLPPLDGAEVREQPDGLETVQFIDARRKGANRGKRLPLMPEVVAGIELDRRLSDRQPVVRINFVFGRYSPLATPHLHGQTGPKPGGPFWNASDNAVECTPFSALVLELNSALLREAFPPKTDTIDVVRPKNEAPYHQWRTRTGWLVKCRNDDAVTVEWVGEKGL